MDPIFECKNLVGRTHSAIGTCDIMVNVTMKVLEACSLEHRRKHHRTMEIREAYRGCGKCQFDIFKLCTMLCILQCSIK